MPTSYQQTGTATGAGKVIACSGGVLIGGGQEQDRLCSIGGTAGGTGVVGGSQFDAGAGQAGVMFEIVPATGHVWGAGSYTVRLNVTTATGGACTWTDTYICRLNSSNVSQATIGSLTGQTTAINSTGVKTHTVTGAAQSPAAGDKIFIVCLFNSPGTNQTFTVTFNQLIDAPIEIPVVITPQTGGLLITGTAPTIINPQTRTPVVGVLSFIGLPAVRTNYARAPPAGQLYFGIETDHVITVPSPPYSPVTFTGYAPTLSTGGVTNTNITPLVGGLTLSPQSANVSRSIAPATGALIITAQAPTLAAGANVSITPAGGSLTLTSSNASVRSNTFRNPGSGEIFFGLDLTGVRRPLTAILSLTGNAPTLSVSGAAAITPSTATLRIGLFGGDWITPSTGALTLTGNAPAINVSALTSRTPTTGALSITGNSPAVHVSVRITPSTGQLVITGQQPTVSLGGGVNTPITPATGALRMTLDPPVGLRLVGYPPTVQVSAGITDTPRTPTTGALVITGLQPILQAGNNVVSQPATGSLVLSGQQPLVARAIIPATGALTITGNQAAGFKPAAGSLAITGGQPVVQTGNNVIKQPSTGALTLAGTVPSIFRTITPSTGALVITGVQPIVQAGNNITKAPTTGGLVLTGAAPDIQAGANVFKTPITGALAIGSVQAQVSRSITPNTGALAITGQTANVQASAHVLVTPGAGSLAIQGFQSTTGGQIRPSTAVLSFTGNAPNMARSITPAAGSLNLQGSQPAQGQVITPAAGSLTVAPQQAITSRGIAPATGSLNIAGVVPNLSRSIAPATGSLTLVGGGPSQATTIRPSSGAMTTVGAQPALSAGIRTNTGALTITGGQPQIPVRLEPSTGALSIGAGGWETAFAAPDFMPGTGSLNISGAAPTAFRPAFEFDAVLGGIDLDLQVSGEEGIILIVDDDVVI